MDKKWAESNISQINTYLLTYIHTACTRVTFKTHLYPEGHRESDKRVWALPSALVLNLSSAFCLLCDLEQITFLSWAFVSPLRLWGVIIHASEYEN